MADKETAQSLLDKILKEAADSKLSPMDFLGTKNATLNAALKALKSGEATISPAGAIVSKNEPAHDYNYWYNQDREYAGSPAPDMMSYYGPKTYLKLQTMPDGSYGLPKIKNEKDGGWFEFSLPKTVNQVYKERIVPARPEQPYIDIDGYWQTSPAVPQKVYQDLVSQELPKDWDTNASVKVIPKIPGGQDFGGQDYFQSSTGVANDVRAVQSGDVVAEKYKEYYEDGSSADKYKLIDANGSVVAWGYEQTQSGVLKSPNYWNHVHAGTNNVYVAFDTKSGRIAPIENFGSQVVYNLSGGKTFWSQITDTVKAAVPVFATIFAPAIGEVIGAALMEAGVVTSASAAAAGAATAAEAATAAAAANATATAVGTGIANATSGILQGKPVDQAIGDAAISTAIQLGTPGAVGDIKTQISQITSNPAISNVVTGATVAAGTALLKGKNAADAFEKGGTYALVNQLGLDIPGFADMNATAKKVLTDVVNAGVSGKDFKLTPEYMVNTLISTATKAAKNTQTANEKFEDVLGRPATEEELKRFATVDTEEELNQSFNSYITEANETSAKKEGWDSLDQKNEAWNAGYRNPDQYDTYLVDKKADEDAVKEGWTSADQKYDALVSGHTSPEEYKNFLTEQANQYELALARDNEKSAVKEVPPSTVVKEKGPENYSNDFGGAVGDTDYIPPWMDSSLTGATKDPADVVDTLVKSGLEDSSNNVDLNKVVDSADTVGGGINQDTVQAVTGADTVSGEAGKDVVNTLVDAGLHDDFDGDNATDEDAEQARRVAEFGKDLTGGGVQDLGEVNTNTDFYDENSTGMGAYKYDPTSGTYTYTSDDGSTLTLDADGNIVGFTEKTDTSWTGLTDTATGKLKLPGLPDGKLPNVKPPVKEKTTTTGTGTTTTTTGAGNTAITTGSNTAVQTGGGLNIAALMAIMGGLGGNQQPQQPQIETYDPGKGFEYFDWESDPFAPKTKDKTNPTGQPKMAGGGSVDELLEILRRSGI